MLAKETQNLGRQPLSGHVLIPEGRWKQQKQHLTRLCVPYISPFFFNASLYQYRKARPLFYQIHPKTPVRKVRNRLNSVHKPYTIESSVSRKILYGKSGSIRAVNGVCEYYLFAHAAAFAATGQLSACFQDVGGKSAISVCRQQKRNFWVLAKKWDGQKA